MSARATCPACGGSDLRDLYHLPAIPAQSVVLLETAEAAQNFPTGELTLTLCHLCGFLFNSTFDASLVDYAGTTEESQHFSGTFNRFAQGLARELTERQDLSNRFTLEIGCGKGDFLTELVSQSGSRALGIDPGYIPERSAKDIAPEIRFLRDYFHPAQVAEVPDLIVCRHTLEHIADVRPFIEDMVAVTAGQSRTQVMFETPDVARVLAEGAFWDIYHEHCSYFTIGSHARLLRRAGLDVSHSRLAYHGQYIIQYATPGQGMPRPEEEDLAQILALAEAFPTRVAAARRTWTNKVQSAARAGGRVAIWGGGSKGVSFLTTNSLGPEVSHVIDINLHKQGKFMPGTGHVVSAPEALRDAPPDLVIVMNPVYLAEIRSELEFMGLSPEVVAL
ncbi:class I SAM-dependent methyltransferase [Tropicimonas sp. S265A]|uniref:class I SAM-dependent methyltransferase n=1 Tax=Tropicimonas sp. S265A TaxID=3415134 RepID=UPI003C7D72BC